MRKITLGIIKCLICGKDTINVYVCDTCAPKVRKSLGVTNARWIPHHIPFKQEKIWMTTYLKKNKEKIKEIKI
jgi:hypothetical protein